MAKLIYADTRRNADQLYLGQVNVPDPFLSFQFGRKSYAVVNQLEYARVKSESDFSEVLSLEDWMAKAGSRSSGKRPGPAEIISAVSNAYGIDGFEVAEDFPVGVALKLKELGLELEVVEGSLFPQRERKSEEELKHIQEGNRCSAAGLRAAQRVLREAKIKGNRLVWKGKTLTSERLREEIEIACLQKGSVSMDTIAAGGDQACDPHCSGYGPLRPQELIIVDVFPRVSRTGYHGDMTRTFLKGKASEEQKGLVDAVRKAQKEALSAIKVGIDGRTVHQSVCTVFEDLGYETRRDEKGAVGFFHGTGHGLGLEVHEAPRLSTVSCRLKKNAVVTVEPGLYYPGIGGCRIEDVVAVKKNGVKLLSSFSYRWRIT